MNTDFLTLTIDRLPKRYNEGLFWGNGKIGAMLYTEGSSLRFAIDHIQIWETRGHDDRNDKPGGTFQDFYTNHDAFFAGEYFKNDVPPGGIFRTKLPGFGFVLDFGKTIIDFHGETNLRNGLSTVLFILEGGKSARLNIMLDSLSNILVVDFAKDGAIPQARAVGWNIEKATLSTLKNWGYAPSSTKTINNCSHLIQNYAEKGIAILSHCSSGKKTVITLDCAFNADEKELIEKNSQLLSHYSAHSDKFLADHLKDWALFWEGFFVTIPNERLQRAFNVEMYKMHCNLRKDGLPMPLMGVWNNDERMPAWTGDFHNDLNVQSCYWAAYKTNNIASTSSYIDYYHECSPRFEKRAEKLFGIKNAIHVPVMMGLNGYATMGEWCFWNTLIGPELFCALDFCWYYDFSGDKKRLAEKVYPFIEKVLNLYIGIAFQGDDGFLHIPFTQSPEVFKGHMLLKEDSTFVISTLHDLLGKMENYAKILGKDEKKWAGFNKALTPIKTTEKGLPLFPDEDLFESHRHFCQLFPIFPIGSETHSPLAEKSLDTVINQGYTGYAGWSFPYLAILASRTGRGNMARTALELYCMAFRSLNTFTVNGDPYRNGVLQVSETNAGECSDVFTIEAGLILPAAISEMFVHRTYSGVYAGFGLPDEWKSAKAENLTIEGGHRVNVTVEDYAVKSVAITPACNESLTVFIKGHEKPFLLKLEENRSVVLPLP